MTAPASGRPVSGSNLGYGGQFWDGIADNEPKQAGQRPVLLMANCYMRSISDGPGDGDGVDPIGVDNGVITNGKTTAGLAGW